MITLPRLLSSAFLTLAALTGVAKAQGQYCPKEFEVIERDEKGNDYSFQKRKLEKLFCTDRFEGEHFKIVYSTDDEAISFNNTNPAILKKAANTYYHLMLARQFWIETINSDYVQKLPQITVRLDITNAFSNLRHFKNAEQEKNYNNAWSIPEGQTPNIAREKHKWGKEIWFSPMKKIESRKDIVSEGNNPVHESLLLVREPVIEYNKNAMIYSGLGLLAAPAINSSSLLSATLQRIATIAVIYGLTQATYYMDKWFIEKWYYIDAALVPDIIYHEFAHIAMSDTMKTVHSVPVIEGMADYFAARIINRKHVYEKMQEISSNEYKSVMSRQRYHPFLEGEWNATSDFTLSLLWKGRLEFDELNQKRLKKGQAPVANYDELIHDAHFHLTETSDIMNDLTGALLKACRNKCANKRTGMNTLHDVFEKKGLN